MGRQFQIEFPSGEDHIARVISQTGGFYEADMLADIRSRLIFPRYAVDVGAHVGNHTIYFAGVLGIDTISFEPNPLNCSLLSANIAANGLTDHCRVRNVAVGGSHGKCVSLPGGAGNSGTSRVNRSEDGSIAIVTLDEELADVPRVDLLKIDVEGWELEVLAGADRSIARCRPLIYVEASEKSFGVVEPHLSSADYVCWRRFNATPTFLFLPRERLGHRR
jgi:FkbM family methyltransferase